MTAKEYLLSVQKAEHELKIISDRRRHYEDLIAAIGSNMGKTSFGKPSNASSKVETAAVGIVYLIDQLATKEKEYTALVQKAEELIGKLEKERFREILTRKYLNGESWKTIRDKMGYRDEKSVYRCHGYALKAFSELMKEG